MLATAWNAEARCVCKRSASGVPSRAARGAGSHERELQLVHQASRISRPVSSPSSPRWSIAAKMATTWGAICACTISVICCYT